MNYDLGQDYLTAFKRSQAKRSQAWNKPFEYKWYHISIVLGAGALLTTYMIAKRRKKRK